MKEAVLYARVSSKEQEQEGYSIPAQQQLLREYAKKQGYKTVAEFTDVETAKKAGRTNFNEMIKFLKKNSKVKNILVEKTDRLYRNFNDYIILENLDVEIHLVKEGEILSKNSTSHVKFIHGIKLLMAKNYIDNLSEETKKGLKQKAIKGEFSNKEPYGYKRLDKNTIIPDPLTAPLVKRAFEIYSEGNISLENTNKKLANEGYFYKHNKPRMAKAQLERILKNEIYRGKVKHCGEIYEGKHEAIVDDILFIKVQRAFRKDNKPLYRKQSFMYGNLIKCGECGCTIVGELKKGKYTYYRCTRNNGRNDCTQRGYVKEEVLELQFEEVVRNINISDEHRDWLVQVFKESLKDEQEYHAESVKTLHEKANKLRERLAKIYEDKLDGVITEEFWSERHSEYKDQLENILIQLNAHEKANISYFEKGLEIIELVNNAYSLYLQQPPEERVELIKLLVSNSILKDGKLSYTYKKPFDVLAKGLSCNNWLPRLDSNQQPTG